MDVYHDNHELHGEAKEEEEVELEEGNVDLHERNRSELAAAPSARLRPRKRALTWKARYLRFSLRSALMCL